MPTAAVSPDLADLAPYAVDRQHAARLWEHSELLCSKGVSR
ncbi:MAG: hypothetical protein WAM92_21575 [Mycobacterium sp.]